MSEPQLYCTECGVALHGAKFCPHCGALTENAAAIVTAEVGAPVGAHAGSGNGAGGDSIGDNGSGRNGAAGNGVGSNGGAGGTGTAEMPTAMGAPSFAGTIDAQRLIDTRRPPAGSPPPAGPGYGPAPAAGGEQPARSRKPLLIAGAAILAVAAAAVAIVLATQGGGGSSYTQQVRGVFAPVLRTNAAMSQRLQALHRGSGTGAARSAVVQTGAAVAAAQRMLARLTAGSGDRGLSNSAQVALTSEASYLDAARAVLADSGSARGAEIAALGETTHAQLLALDPQVPGASASFAGWESLAAYARQRSSDSALRAFSRQVDALLAQSAGSFQEINHVFGQMQIAASGGVTTISLAQAEASLGSVIANRNALAASARTLSAPSARAAEVRDALAGAFDASLTNDRDIQECLDEANSGSVAWIFQSCLSSTVGSSSAATAAKQHFVSAYNDLRRSVNLPSVQPSF